MTTVTIPKREYRELIDMKDKGKKKKTFVFAGFGAFKKSFGTKTSSFYVSKMRKSWRA